MGKEIEMRITFRKSVDDIRLMAVYVSSLIKEGVAFEIKEFGNESIGESFEVVLTGGF
jgi:hypothetical protein